MTAERLRGLLELAEMQRNRDLSRLEAATREDAGIVEEIAGLAGVAVRDLDVPGDPLPPVMQGLRHAWADNRIRMLRQRRAQIALEITGLRESAARSFGKHRALEELCGRAERDETGRTEARAEREAPPQTGS